MTAILPSLPGLNDDSVECLLSFCRPRELCVLQVVCRRMWHVCRRDALWERVFSQTYPAEIAGGDDCTSWRLRFLHKEYRHMYRTFLRHSAWFLFPPLPANNPTVERAASQPITPAKGAGAPAVGLSRSASTTSASAAPAAVPTAAKFVGVKVLKILSRGRVLAITSNGEAQIWSTHSDPAVMVHSTTGTLAEAVTQAKFGRDTLYKYRRAAGQAAGIPFLAFKQQQAQNAGADGSGIWSGALEHKEQTEDVVTDTTAPPADNHALLWAHILGVHHKPVTAADIAKAKTPPPAWSRASRRAHKAAEKEAKYAARVARRAARHAAQLAATQKKRSASKATPQSVTPDAAGGDAAGAAGSDSDTPPSSGNEASARRTGGAARKRSDSSSSSGDEDISHELPGSWCIGLFAQRGPHCWEEHGVVAFSDGAAALVHSPFLKISGEELPTGNMPQWLERAAGLGAQETVSGAAICGSSVIVCSHGRTASIWRLGPTPVDECPASDMSSRLPVHTYMGHTSRIVALGTTPEGMVCTGDRSGHVHVWCATTGDTLRRERLVDV